MDDVLKLPDVMDASAARQVFEELLARRGRAMRIDASSVSKVSALALEVVVSAARQWAEDGKGFAVQEMSEGFRETCADLGVPLDLLAAPGDIEAGTIA